MIFTFSTCDQSGRIRECSLVGVEVGTALKLLDSIIARGHILTKMTVWDKDRLTDIPLESFDGRPCLPQVEALEHEWKQILAEFP